MTSIDPLLLAGAKAKGKRPYFLAGEDTERLMTIVMALAQEVAVMRERMDTIERLLDRKGVVARGDIDRFEPTKSEADERGAWTQEFIARILRILQQEREALSMGDQYSEEVADELAKS
jgi:nitrogen fixation/metabolism regulation signal transduction histidine kinase